MRRNIMAKYAFPAIFESEEEGGYSIYFPDIEGCYTQAESIPEGIENAGDALCLMLYELERQGKQIPKPANINQVSKKTNDIVSLVACDTQYYKNYYEGKSVKINATIPLWLKEAGEKHHVNFSQILQRGVKDFLQII